jgi:hypothetical protein
MSIEDSDDTELGRTLRDEGMALVEENSGAWKDRAKEKIDFWFRSQPREKLFVGEDIRLELEFLGLEQPHHPNAWSAVIGGRVRGWLKDNLIEVYGLTSAKDPKAHARRMITYRKLK